MLLIKIGFKRRLPNTIEGFPNSNTKKLNKYMTYAITRLRSAKSPRHFWFLAIFLMKNSTAFRVSAINKVFHNWYKIMPLSYVININEKADKIIKKGLDNLEFKRTYIPKDADLFNKMGRENYEKMGGKWRPLGVPTAAWRLVLHMWNNFLTMFLDSYLGDRQHAYRPNRGCLTAWRDLVGKVNEYNFIYEVDLKGCFDNIQSQHVTDILMKLGMPPGPAYYLENINRCTPKFRDTDLIDESKLRDKALWSNLKKMETEKPRTMYTELEENPLLYQWVLENYPDVDEFLQEQWALCDQYWPSSMGTSHLGLPQGANTSPILTAAVLKEFTEQQDSIFYADDGIFFSNKDFTIKDDPDKGIFLNTEKSKWIKRDGEWMGELKFLGLVYNPWKDTLRGNTRKGSTLEFNRKANNIHTLLRKFQPKNWSQGMTKWERLFKSTLGGTVMAKLYNATWEELEYLIHWQPKGVKNSWLDIKGKIDNFKTTSSSACQALASIISSGGSVPGSSKGIKFVEDQVKTLPIPEESKSKYRAIKVNGRWIKVLATRFKTKEKKLSNTGVCISV